jgi:ABC transporter substrate binding protein
VGSAVACPLSVRAQPTVKVYRVGLVFSGGRDFWELDSNVPNAEALSEGLRDLGYVQGHNLALSWRSAEGKGNKRAAEIGTELIQNGIDVIVVDMGSSTVPILMTASLDPVAQGVATNLARPGGNVTGIAVTRIDVVPRRGYRTSFADALALIDVSPVVLAQADVVIE